MCLMRLNVHDKLLCLLEHNSINNHSGMDIDRFLLTQF